VADGTAPRKRSTAVVWIVVGVLALVAAGGLLGLRSCGPQAPAVAGVTDVSIGYGTLTVVQDGADRLEIKADTGVAALAMARRDGNQLSLGLADDADPRVLIGWLLPPLDPNAKLEFVLHTTSATRFAADDHGDLRMGGFKAGELRLSTMSVATIVASHLDVGALEVWLDGGSTGSVILSGRATSESVLTNGSSAEVTDAGLKVGPR
jgi:hypothetical protein